MDSYPLTMKTIWRSMVGIGEPMHRPRHSTVTVVVAALTGALSAMEGQIHAPLAVFLWAFLFMDFQRGQQEKEQL
jgi:hypothetical protein